MAKPRHDRIPAVQGKVGYGNPPMHSRFQKGESGNPAGRKTAGAYVREWLNVLAEKELSESELRAIARDKAAPWTKRTAAERILRTLEAGDLADMEPVLDGVETLTDLRNRGINTEVVKKMKVKTRTTDDGAREVDREIELHDRAGEDFDRILDRTLGKPAQAIDVTSNGDSIVKVLAGVSMKDL